MEYRKNHKRKIALFKRIIASSLSTTFCTGTVSGCVGATEQCFDKSNVIDFLNRDVQDDLKTFMKYVKALSEDTLVNVPQGDELLRLLDLTPSQIDYFNKNVKNKNKLPNKENLLNAYANNYLDEKEINDIEEFKLDFKNSIVNDAENFHKSIKAIVYNNFQEFSELIADIKTKDEDNIEKKNFYSLRKNKKWIVAISIIALLLVGSVLTINFMLKGTK